MMLAAVSTRVYLGSACTRNVRTFACVRERILMHKRALQRRQPEWLLCEHVHRICLDSSARDWLLACIDTRRRDTPVRNAG
eukprot:6176561-Pleurochrysis_carterae.AAC.5